MNRTRSSSWSWGAVTGGIAVAGVLLAWYWVPLDQWSFLLIDWVRSAGALGVAGFAVAYVVATIAMLPGAALTLVAGFVYGPVWGTLLISPVSVIAAALAFLLGRSVARPWVAARVAARPEFEAIDAAIAAQGFRIVFLLRLSPLFPYNLLNYGLALTGISFWSYVAASAIGMLPGTFLYVYLGSLVPHAAQLVRGRPEASGPLGNVLYWAGLVATLAATMMITRAARKALRVSLTGAAPPRQETAANRASAQR